MDKYIGLGAGTGSGAGIGVGVSYVQGAVAGAGSRTGYGSGAGYSSGSGYVSFRIIIIIKKNRGYNFITLSKLTTTSSY